MAPSNTYEFQLKAELENIEKLMMAGTYVSFYFKLKCENCGAVTPKELAAKYGVKDHAMPDGTPCCMEYKCRGCFLKGFVDLVSSGKRSLLVTDTDGVCLMKIHSYGYELVEPSLNGGFRACKGKSTGMVNLVDGSCTGKYDDGSIYSVKEVLVSLKKC